MIVYSFSADSNRINHERLWIDLCFTLLETGIASNVIYLNSTTNKFSIFWNNPTTDYELVSGYEVNWRVPGGSWISSNRLGRTVNQYTASSNLISGQLYTVNVVSQVTLSNPAGSVIVTSINRKLRTGMEHYITTFT